MPYQILISTGETPLFRTGRYSADTIQHLKTLFGVMDQKFPKEEGFNLTVERFLPFPTTIPREAFQAACASQDPKDMFKLFVPEVGFRQFQQAKGYRKPTRVRSFIHELENYDHVEQVILYRPGYYLFQLRYKDSVHYLLPDDPDIKSNDLEELEYELYLSFLQGAAR